MERIINVFDKVAYFSMTGMVLIVVASVLGRIVFDITGGGLNLVLPGSIELVSYALLIMVFSSLPRAVVNRLVSVDLLLAKLPRTARQILERLWDLLLATFTIVIGTLFFHKMVIMFERGDVSQDLGIPLFIIYGILSLCCVCITATCVWLAFSSQRPENSDY